MTSREIREKFRRFFEKRGHKWIPPASLVPQNDPTTLFTSSGMQPLVPYLLGQPHPEGKRLANSQPSFRSQDIEEVGDNRHTTFFEMLGNWSLGDYFKKEQLDFFFTFLTDKNEGLGLDPQRLYVTVFAGNDQIPKDTESIKIWRELFSRVGIKAEEEERIFPYGVDKNWWSRSGTPENMPPGEIGGPDSEVFYEFTQREHDKKFGEKCHPNCECGKFLEIGNSVFIQHQKQEDGTLKELPNKNVDFGGGLERLTAAVNNEPDIFKIDLFWPIIKKLEELSGQKYVDNKKNFRIIADHLRASVFLIKDGVVPGNKQHGYVLRRLLRRVATKAFLSNRDKSDSKFFGALIKCILAIYPEYFEEQDKKNIQEVISIEIRKFRATLERGLQQLDKSIKDKENLGLAVFNLYQSYGYPLELTIELLGDRGIQFTDYDLSQFKEAQKAHAELSRTVLARMFKGGLQDQSEITTKYHTATHLLHAALRKILGDHVQQKGSNITAERLRFDFSHPQKITTEELKKVEDMVNKQIQKNLSVTSETMNKEDALKSGALGFFAQKYGDKVTVYSIGGFSKEICGGPHVDFTGKLGTFRIEREESAGSGIRRIYAIVGGK